jgi:hypothetical protein
MGTNFYWITGQEIKEECPHCGHEYTKPEEIHIGKSSGGWCFALHVYPEKGITVLDHWIDIWSKAQKGEHIKNEYGDIIPWTEMLANIADRANWFDGPTPDESNEWYRLNSAEPGPNNLARNKIDNRHCIGHGDGTWDYLIGEFS